MWISGGDRRNIYSKIGFDFASLAEGGMQVFARKHCLKLQDLLVCGTAPPSSLGSGD